MSDTPTIAVTRSGLSLLQDVVGPARRPCLILYSGADAGLPFDLEPGVYTVGRAPESSLQLESPGISRRHAELRVSEDAVLLADLGSSNGTFVNEVRIGDPVRLRGGDVVRFGVLVLRFYESQSLEAALHDRIYRTATVDPGTEVFNRRYLFDALKREMRLARQHNVPLAVVIYDLDHFKLVNDRHGHAAGDVVLRDSAAIVRASLAGTGMLGRLGGEEFGIVLPHHALAQAVQVADRARQAVADHRFVLGDSGVPGPSAVVHRQTVSMGVASLAPDMADPIDLIAAADRKLYESKNGGRDRVSA
ncbi:MAG: GGDEF domain-containing protein [Rubrivivax sp.]